VLYLPAFSDISKGLRIVTGSIVSPRVDDWDPAAGMAAWFFCARNRRKVGLFGARQRLRNHPEVQPWYTQGYNVRNQDPIWSLVRR